MYNENATIAEPGQPVWSVKPTCERPAAQF